jgi:iron uptake system component EfeO
MRLMLAAAGLLALAGLATFWLAARGGAPGPVEGEIAVTVTDTTCEPADFTVPAGKRTFRIHNASDRPLEWEILDGVMVVAERENIAPGLNSTLTERLKPGGYDITCGLLSNPRGTLTVTATLESEASRTQPETRAFIGPLSEYRVYLNRRSTQLARATEALAQRIEAGDVPGARDAWLEARQPWRNIAPVSSRIGDLQNSMDPLPDYLAKREEDPGFTGFHRIEYGLWSVSSTEGLGPFANRLAAESATLKERLSALDLVPADLADNAAALASRVADQATADQAPYSGSDLAEFSADLDGIAKSVLLVDPLVASANPTTSEALHKALDDARATLDGFRTGDAFPPYSAVDAQGRAAIAAAFAAVAAAAAEFNPAIGLE